MNAAGVNALIELVGDDAEVSILHYDVAGDGGQDLLAIFVPAGEGNGGQRVNKAASGLLGLSVQPDLVGRVGSLSYN